MMQAALCFETPKIIPQKAETVVGIVLTLMGDGEWWTPYQLAKMIAHRRGKWISDAAVTARLRDLRKKEFGAYNIVCRRKADSDSWEYRLSA